MTHTDNVEIICLKENERKTGKICREKVTMVMHVSSIITMCQSGQNKKSKLIQEYK